MKENQIITALVVALIVVLGVLAFRVYERSDSEIMIDASAPTSQTFRLGLNIPEGTALHAAALRFAERVHEKSNGRIRVTVHPNQELGNDNQMLEMARRGELAMILTPTAKLSTAVPAMQVLDLPFFFPSREVLYTALDGEFGAQLLGKLDDIGLRGVTFWENGFKHFTANRPLRNPSDFHGLKMRIMKSRIIQEQFEAMGASTLPIDFHSTRQALVDGVVDGQENPLVAIVSMGFHKVQSHLTLSSHAYLGYAFSISMKRLNEMSLDDQRILLSSAREITQWEREETRRREQAFLNTIREAGVTVTELTPEEIRLYQAALEHLPRQFEPNLGTDIVSLAEQAILFSNMDANETSPILIGLDADLSMMNPLAAMAIKQGTSLAIQDINQSGGVLGRQLVLVARDHQGVPERGRDNVRFFNGMDNLVAIMGGKNSPVVREELDLIQQFGIPYLIPWAAAAALTEETARPNFVFRVSLNDREVAPFLVDEALRRGNRVALAFEESSWGRGNRVIMEQYLQSLDMNLAGSFSIPTSGTDFKEIVGQVTVSRANSIILVASPEMSKNFLKALFGSGLEAPVISHWGLLGGHLEQGELNMLAQREVIFPQTAFLSPPTTATGRSVMERYHRYFHTGAETLRQVGSGFANAYDLTHLLAKAIRLAGVADRRAVRDALEQLPPHDGFVKNYTRPFSENRHDALGRTDFRLGRFNETGNLVPVTLPGQ